MIERSKLHHAGFLIKLKQTKKKYSYFNTKNRKPKFISNTFKCYFLSQLQSYLFLDKSR